MLLTRGGGAFMVCFGKGLFVRSFFAGDVKEGWQSGNAADC